VLNKDYWDADTSSYVKKWKLDKRTCNLQFNNKWVSGLLRRSTMKLPCPVNDSALNGGNKSVGHSQSEVCNPPNSRHVASGKSPDNTNENLSGRKTLSGRPVSDEFEAAVLGECQLSGVSKKKKSTSNGFSYLSVKMCANKVLNKDYWDADSFSFTKKWKLDRRTSKLKFTNKWVCGFLRRTLNLDSSKGKQPSKSIMPRSNGPDAPISTVPHHNVSTYFDLKEGDLDRIMAFFD